METNNADKSKTTYESAVTFEEAMDKIGTGYFQYKITFVGGLIITASYTTSNVIAFVLPVAQCDLHMTSEDKGKLASVFFIGVMLTCHMWGFLSDTMGRQYVLFRCLLIDGLLYVMSLLTPNFYVILFLRFINGITSCGGFVSAYAYVGEFQTNKFKSHSLMLASFFGTFAFILMPCIAWLVLPAKWHFQLYPGLIIRPWKFFYALCGVPSLTAAILLYFLPESPKFLLAKGNNKKALEVLEKIYKENHKDDEKFPINGLKINEMEKVETLNDNQNKILAVFKLIWNQTVPLLRKPHRFNLILLLLCFFLVVYINNGLYVWLPVAINRLNTYRKGTGKHDGSYCDVLQYKEKQFSTYSVKHHVYMTNNNMTNASKFDYTINKFEEVEVCNDEPDSSVYIIYLILGIFLMLAWILVTIANRFFCKKYLIIGMQLISLLSMISMEMSNDVTIIPLKAGFSMVTTGSVYPIINSIVVDLFPTNLRAMASCLTVFTCRLGSFSTHTVSGILIDKHCNIMLLLMTAATAVSLVLVFFLPKNPPDEVSNTKLEKINEEA